MRGIDTSKLNDCDTKDQINYFLTFMHSHNINVRNTENIPKDCDQLIIKINARFANQTTVIDELQKESIHIVNFSGLPKRQKHHLISSLVEEPHIMFPTNSMEINILAVMTAIYIVLPPIILLLDYTETKDWQNNKNFDEKFASVAYFSIALFLPTSLVYHVMRKLAETSISDSNHTFMRFIENMNSVISQIKNEAEATVVRPTV